MWPFRAFFRQTERIYMDYAAATPIAPEAKDAMVRAMRFVGNPGAIHQEGVEAMRSLTQSREIIAAELGCKAREIVFTGGLTEANNLAIVGHARYLERTRRSLEGTHWIVSGIEHPSVLDCFYEIERMGGAVSHVMPDGNGMIRPERVAELLNEKTVFVSVGWANSEIGTIQPLARIAARVRDHEARFGTQVLFHADAGQAPLYLSSHVHSLGVDILTMGAHKLHGPHGIGALYLSNRTQLAKIMFGGSQERGLRAGTPDVPATAGFAAACKKAAQMRVAEAARIGLLRDTLVQRLQATLPGLIINGDVRHTLPHMLNISIPNISGEYTVLALDHEGIAVSTKSTCREGENPYSHVVAALGGDEWRARNTVRFSLGRENTMQSVEIVATALANIARKQQG